MNTLIAIALIVGAAVIFVFFLVAVVTRFYRKVPQSQALIISRIGNIEVTFTGAFIKPVFDRAEMMDIGVKVIEVEKSGSDGLICKDNIRADIRVSFYVRVNNTTEDVKKVAQLVGCANASSQQKLEELFSAKFAESLKTAGKQMEFHELFTERIRFREEIQTTIGKDLDGFILQDVAVCAGAGTDCSGALLGNGFNNGNNRKFQQRLRYGGFMVEVERVRGRLKKGGPDAAAVRRRWELESRPGPFGGLVIRINTSRPLDETVRTVVGAVWSAL